MVKLSIAIGGVSRYLFARAGVPLSPNENRRWTQPMMMSAADVAKNIQLIIAPVILTTACALIQNAILIRYAAVGQYMRSLALERLQLLRSREITDLFFLERLQEIDRQVPLLTQRHRLLQNVILMSYGSISIFLMSMFAIALTVAIGSDAAATFALILFLLGTGVLLTGVFLTTLEIHISHRVICYEVGRIAMLEIISK